MFKFEPMDEQAPPPSEHFLTTLNAGPILPNRAGEEFGSRITPDTDFTVKKPWWSKELLVIVHTKEGDEYLNMGPVNRLAEMLKDNPQASAVWPGFNEIEVSFLRKVLWDVHNFVKELEPEYRALLDLLDALEGKKMHPAGMVRVGPAPNLPMGTPSKSPSADLADRIRARMGS